MSTTNELKLKQQEANAAVEKFLAFLRSIGDTENYEELAKKIKITDLDKLAAEK